MKASVAVEIDHPIADIFSFITDIETMELWVEGVEDPRRSSDGDFGVGSTFTSKYRYGGKTHRIDYRVTAFEAPYCFGTESTAGPFPYRGLIELESTRRGTRLINTIEAGADGLATRILFGLFGPLLRWGMRRQIRKELVGLKAILERAPGGRVVSQA